MGSSESPVLDWAVCRCKQAGDGLSLFFPPPETNLRAHTCVNSLIWDLDSLNVPPFESPRNTISQGFEDRCRGISQKRSVRIYRRSQRNLQSISQQLPPGPEDTNKKKMTANQPTNHIQREFKNNNKKK